MRDARAPDVVDRAVPSTSCAMHASWGSACGARLVGAWNVFSPPWSDFGWSLRQKRAEDCIKASAVPTARGRRGYLLLRSKGNLCVRIRWCRHCVRCVARQQLVRARQMRRLEKINRTVQRTLGGLNYGLPPLPCAICGEPATKMSSQNARAKGGARKPYCEKHKGGLLTKITRLPCAVCSAPATLNSTKMSLNRGDKPYCVQHKGGPSAKLPPLPCTICGAPATRSSSQNARRCGRKPYCEKHKGGPPQNSRPASMWDLWETDIAHRFVERSVSWWEGVL